jgi:ArsR family transcriptional regulator
MEETQPKVSRHLAKLRDVGYVQDRRQGQWIYYYLTVNDKIASGILSAIVNDKEQYPILKRDFERLQSMISGKCLCQSGK